MKQFWTLWCKQVHVRRSRFPQIIIFVIDVRLFCYSEFIPKLSRDKYHIRFILRITQDFSFCAVKYLKTFYFQSSLFGTP